MTKKKKNTVARTLERNDIEIRVVKKKPLLTTVQIRKRKAWAKVHNRWKHEEWSKVVWSDEISFKVFARPPRSFYKQRKSGKRKYNPAAYQPTVKYSEKINVWGCFNRDGVGPIKKIEGKMTAKIFHGVLTHTAMPHIWKLAQEGKNTHAGTLEVIFQQDNDPKHRANANVDYMESKLAHAERDGFDLSYLDWPSQSPDMNPIRKFVGLY